MVVADIGLDTILDVLSDATWGLVLAALVVVQFTNATDAISVAAILRVASLRKASLR